jgi:putative ABC transport system substrate-binding protein
MQKIGILHSGNKENSSKQIDALIGSVGAEGFRENDNVEIICLYAEGDGQKLRDHARDLVKKHEIDVFVAAGGSACAKIAQKETEAAQRKPKNRMPVVFTSVADPIRPAPHMTGVCARTSECDPIRLELLRELMPTKSKVGVLYNPLRPSAQMKKTRTAAKELGLKLVEQKAAKASDIDAAFKKLAKVGLDALLVNADPLFNNNRQKVVDSARELGKPVIYQWREFVEAGGFMSYGPNLTEAYKLAGIYVAKLLTGVSASDLPVVLLTKFELVCNNTAWADRIALPPTLEARAEKI